MRLLVCGSRHWTAEGPILEQLLALRPDVLIHGAASGADTIAGEACGVRCIPVERFPADWARDGRAAGPLRNELMLREGKPDRGLAFGALWRRGGAAPLWKRTGTGDMVRRMLDAGLYTPAERRRLARADAEPGRRFPRRVGLARPRVAFGRSDVENRALLAIPGLRRRDFVLSSPDRRAIWAALLDSCVLEVLSREASLREQLRRIMAACGGCEPGEADRMPAEDLVDCILDHGHVPGKEASC